MARFLSLLSALLVVSSGAHAAESATIGPIDIEQAIVYALGHHPALHSQQAIEDAQRALVSVGRAGYAPSLDLSAQINVGSGNVLRGSLFPMREIPNVSGPPTGRDIGDASFGSALGLGVGWDAVGLVRQMAQVDAALAGAQQSHATSDVVRLQVAYAAADQFIAAIARAQTVTSARATVDRMRVLVTIVKALTDQELRPGADLSRASAELALASTQLIRAEQAEAIDRIALARALGAAGTTVAITPGRLLEGAGTTSASNPTSKSPEVLEADAAVHASEARKRAVALAYVPRLDVVGALWVRGSGLTSGTVAPSPGAGLAPDTPNWAAGIVLSWPALEAIATHARVRVEAAQVKAAEARRADVVQAVQSQIDTARQTLDAARRIAQNTPVALKAARDAEQQATARYRSGLASVDAVAEAERLLAQAEIDDAVARLNVRRSELLLARAVGDLAPFLDELRGAR